MMQPLENFILSVGSFLGLFSSINRLICPITHNSHQISYILKVFYSDLKCIFMYALKLYLRYILYMYICLIYIMITYVCIFEFDN